MNNCKVCSTISKNKRFQVVFAELSGYNKYDWSVKINEREISKKYKSYVKQLKGNSKRLKVSLVRNTPSNRFKKLGYRK